MTERPAREIDAVIVLHESGSVIDGSLAALADAAPRSVVNPIIVDNASTDAGPRIAESRLGAGSLIRSPRNLGFAGGVDLGLARCRHPWIALVNPDLRFAPGALDILADFLEAHPRVGLVGPLVRLAEGGREATAGVFPTAAREHAHAWFLDRWLGRAGRGAEQPDSASRVDWISGCAWLLRREALVQAGPLDDGFFMYVEDVDYGRRLQDSGWEVWVEPRAHAVHVRGTGSSASGLLPADGGRAMLRYFEKHATHAEQASARRALAAGWTIRRVLHMLRAWARRPGAERLERRYARALEDLRAGD